MDKRIKQTREEMGIKSNRIKWNKYMKTIPFTIASKKSNT
jgi:hypothetical protein